MRKPRNANRGTTQAIEDQFAGLSCDQQERVLETLTSLHRWCKRERSRKADSPVDPPHSGEGKRESGSQTGLAVAAPGRRGAEAEAAGRAAYYDAIGQPDPAKNAALDIPEEPKQ